MNRKEIYKQISLIEQEITKKKNHIIEIEAMIENDLKYLLELKSQMQYTYKPLPKQKVYLTLRDHNRMGRKNRICQCPYAVCLLHNCLLSYKDVEQKKCVMKMCNYLSHPKDDPILLAEQIHEDLKRTNENEIEIVDNCMCSE